MSKSKHIKLHIPGESFWAIQLTEDTATVDNILLNPEVGYKDVVKFDPENNEVISVIVKNSNTFGLKYAVTDEIAETYKKIVKHFESNSIGVEGMTAGMALLSVPVGLSKKNIAKTISECPVEVEFMSLEAE